MHLRSSVFLSEVTDQRLLRNRFILNDQALDETQLKEFAAKQTTLNFLREEPVFRIWLIPSLEKGKTFILMKANHGLFDGMSVL